MLCFKSQDNHQVDCSQCTFPITIPSPISSKVIQARWLIRMRNGYDWRNGDVSFSSIFLVFKWTVIDIFLWQTLKLHTVPIALPFPATPLYSRIHSTPHFQAIFGHDAVTCRGEKFHLNFRINKLAYYQQSIYLRVWHLVRCCSSITKRKAQYWGKTENGKYSSKYGFLHSKLAISLQIIVYIWMRIWFSSYFIFRINSRFNHDFAFLHFPSFFSY